MISKFKKTLALIMIYFFTLSIISVDVKTVQAATTIPEYNNLISAYTHSVAVYKDKVIFNDNYDGYFVNGGNKQKLGYSAYYFDELSDNKIWAYIDTVRYAINVETAQILYSIDDKEAVMQQKLETKYTSRNDVYINSYQAKDYNGVLWCDYSAFDEEYNATNGFVNSNGTIIEVNDMIMEYTVANGYIYYIGINIDTFDCTFNTLSLNTGKVENSYNVPLDNYDVYPDKVGSNYVILSSDNAVKKYVVSNGKMTLAQTQTITGYQSYDADIYGNIYTVTGGYVKKLVNNSWVNLYKVNSKMSKITVYDEKNMVVTGYDSEKTGFNTIINAVSDFENHWAKNEIKYAMDKGWILTTNTFRPDDAITRAEFIKIVNKSFNYTTKGTVTFTDVKSTDWFYNDIAIALKNGVISSKNSTFRPNEPITREEVAIILTNIKNNKDSKIDKLNNYSDKDQVSSWAITSVEGAIEAGYMGQNATQFRPKSNITRAEAVVTLYRVAN